MTFRELENSTTLTDTTSYLGEWYASVRDTMLGNLSDGDLARAIRQKLFLAAILPEAMNRLTTDPHAGDTYDGELLASLGNVPAELWANHQDLRQKIITIMNSIHPDRVDVDTAKDIEAIRKNIKG